MLKISETKYNHFCQNKPIKGVVACVLGNKVLLIGNLSFEHRLTVVSKEDDAKIIENEDTAHLLKTKFTLLIGFFFSNPATIEVKVSLTLIKNL